jgi:hypothetical protein
MDEMLAFLSSFHPLSAGCLAYLRMVTKSKRVFKNDVLVEIGEINCNLYFIKAGALHCYYYFKDRPISDWFYLENETVVSSGSFCDQVPSKDCMVALEDSELFYITSQEYDYLNRNFLEFNCVARLVMEKYLKAFRAHIRFIRKYQAVDRYHLILSKMPELVQRVPVAPLASWLNMEPETLSRMRGRRE